MPSSLPVLRAPPFPKIRPRVAMVSMPRADHHGTAVSDLRDGADTLVNAIRTARVGGTFWGPTPPSMQTGPIVILRPYSCGDACLMAADALRDTDPARVIALLPRARWTRMARNKLSAFGIAVVTGDIDPWPLFQPDALVLAHGDDELVLLAQIAGIRVSVRSPGRFAPASARRAPTIADRAFGDLVAATVYRNPMTGAPSNAIATVALLANWRDMIDANRGIAVATGMAHWKRRELERFLWVGRDRPLRFVHSTNAAVREARRSGGAIVTWPSRSPAGLHDTAAAAGIPVYKVEDGFIRSVGLGAACVPPLSIAIDTRGIHYDPSHPSDLERLLQETVFDADLTERARNLIDYIVDHGISKYGTDRTDIVNVDRLPGRRRVLVTGQVEDDLSVRLGGAGITGNLDLLARVRAAEPEAEIWYRPHPDVEAGLRRGRVHSDAALVYADQIVSDGSMATLFGQIDAIHVLTSLAGFEALLRGIEVVVHGYPFYAGWGLTRDLAPPIVRRSRRLTLVDLVSGVLLLYPRYLDPLTGLPCGAQQMAESLVSQGSGYSSALTRLQRIKGRLNRLAMKRITG